MKHVCGAVLLWAMLYSGVQLAEPTLRPGMTIGHAYLSLQDQCVYSEDCHVGECAVSDGHGRWACTPRQYTMAVWDRTCLDKVELSEDAKFEAPVDETGKPQTRQGKLTGAVVTLKDKCQFRYEVRTRSGQ